MASTRKERRLSIRLSGAKAHSSTAPLGLCGRSPIDFVPEAAIRAAEDTLMEARLIRMTPKGFSDFLSVLSAPARPIAEIVELAKRPAPWEDGLR